MGSKIGLIYEDRKYIVSIDGSEVEGFSDIEKAFEKFKQVIKNNNNSNEQSWIYIEETIKSFENKNVEINGQFKTVTIGPLKYFYNTGKVFYISESDMTQLIGGYGLIKFILETPGLQEKENIESFLELCKAAVENGANYRLAGGSLTIISAVLNYGRVEFDFNYKKINKGIAIEDGTFEEFKKYVLETIN